MTYTGEDYTPLPEHEHTDSCSHRVNAGPAGDWLRCKYPYCERTDEHDPTIHEPGSGSNPVTGHANND